ncbi:unnamed protein product [Mucor hiemalis]
MDYQDEKIKPSRYAILRWFGFDQFVPETAVTSHWISSKALFAIRLILAVYTTITMWVNIGVSKSGKTFAFFTTLTFVGLHAYNVTACVHHFRYLRNKNMNFMLNQPSFLNYLYVYLYCTVVTFNIVTPVVFWSILAKGYSPKDVMGLWLNVSLHLVTFFIMIIDVILNRMRIPIRMVIFVILTVLFYMFLAFIVYATNGFWVYPFLDWKQGGKAAIWYVAVALIVVVSFFIQVLIHYLRDLIARKMGKSVPNQKAASIDSNPPQIPMNRLDTNQSSVV